MKNLLFTLAFCFITNIVFAQNIQVWPTVVENNINIRVYSNSLEEYIFLYDDFGLDITYELKEVKISIYESINGRLIKSYNIKESYTYSQINVENLKSGVYIMIIDFDQHIHKTKFVKV